MFVLSLVVLTVVAAASAALQYTVGKATGLQDLVIVYVAMLVATEASLATIRALRGRDQAAATQAGLVGMVLLMVLAIGILAACWSMGVLAQPEAITRWSPLLFLAALTTVAVDAIRTIRRAPVAGKAANDATDRAK